MRPLIMIPAALSVLAAGCAPSSSARLETNKDLVRRFTEATNAADWDALATIVAEDFTRHSAATPGPPVGSREEFVQLQKSFLVGFPDQRVTVEQLVAEDDYVAARATYSGTQTGPMGEFAATGRTVESPFLALFRIEGGRIAELWVEWDNVAMLTQLGLFPSADQKAIAERFLRGLYGCEPSVVSELAADSVAVSYPIFEELFKTPAIRGRANVEQFARGFCERWKDTEITVHEALADDDRVVMVWSFRARNAASGAIKSWGGITLYRFDSTGRIAAEVGEESSPGPVERLSVPAEEP